METNKNEISDDEAGRDYTSRDLFRVYELVAEGVSQNYTREYLSLFSGSSQFSQSASFVDYDKFGEHYCLFLVISLVNVVTRLQQKK